MTIQFSTQTLAQHSNPAHQQRALDHSTPPIYRITLPTPVTFPGIGQIAKGRVITIRHNSPAFFDLLSSLYIPRLSDRMLLRAKEWFLPKDQKNKIHSFEELKAYLTKNMYDLSKEDLSYLDSYLYNFKITENDLYSILGDSPFYTIINARGHIRNDVNRTIEPFVDNLRRNIQKAYFCKHFEVYLSSLSQEQLNQVTEEELFNTCKSYSRHFHADFISDKDLKGMIKELLASEKEKRAETITEKLVESLKNHLLGIPKDELFRLTPEFLFCYYTQNYGSILNLISNESYNHFKNQVRSLLALTTEITQKLEKHLSQIPDDKLSPLTFEKSLFDLCKGYVKNSRTHSISDKELKKVTKKLLASEKSKRAETIFRRLIKELQDCLGRISKHDLLQLTPERLFGNYESNYSSTLNLVSKKSYNHFKNQVAHLLNSKKAQRSSSPEEFKSPNSLNNL